ncbi:MAG: transcription antitermination factor NusB [Lachnospiraceae bacterium]|nr:transcription antitermination factor NusB [Lachnospiraceae bacterium]MDD7333098.1 transcription antitermination factor NusB [Lachnospiraceae bacterium]MDY5521822.1 transcription antitermination factor NusB [Agathobacter sp.]
MTRRELRDNVFKMLFRIEFHEAEEMPEQLALFEDELDTLFDGKQGQENRDYLTNKCNDIFSHITELDEAINEVSSGWKTSRMSKVDLTIIRLAVYEMRYEEDIPVAVSINEAVELAKKYGTDDSASFVNGILAKLA